MCAKQSISSMQIEPNGPDDLATGAAAPPVNPDAVGGEEAARPAGDDDGLLTGDAVLTSSSYLCSCIHNFKMDIVELVETFFRPRHELAADITREVSVELADEMTRLLFVGLADEPEPEPEPEQQQQQQHDDEGGGRRGTANSDGGGGRKETPPVISSAGFVDCRYMRLMIQAFLQFDLVDVDDEEKDTCGERIFLANFMAATSFVNRLWDVRRIVAVCREAELDDGERKATTMEMLSSFEDRLNVRAWEVKLGTFSLVY